MKLLELKIHPDGPSGWQSNRLIFGKKTTQLYGPNGSGKTPIIQSIVYALGYPVVFRNDISEKCASVELKVDFDGIMYTILRDIGKQFSVTVNGGGEEKRFYDEKEYTAYLLGKWRFEQPTLLANDGKPAAPYISTFLPLIYLDQDDGYSSIYKSQKTFIKDQFSEMMRIAFGLPPKNSFTRKKDVIKAKEKLDVLDIRVTNKRKVLDELKVSVVKARSLDELENELKILREELNELKKNKAAKSSSMSGIDALILEKRSEHKEIISRISDLRSRVYGIESIRSEIETEINTLSLNEEARKVFHSFEEICASKKCGLFFSSAESYGKNLLYLRDQIKDLERNAEVSKIKITTLEENKSRCEREIQIFSEKRESVKEASEVEGLVEAVGELTERIFELEYERKTLEKLDDSESDFVMLLNERENVLNLYNELASNRNTSSVESARIRNELRNKIIYWLDVLRTSNVSRDVSISPDFYFDFGGEKINQIKGSTRVRVVLSIHAAIFEMVLDNEESGLKFYIMDTPKQHEMHNVDLSDYIGTLESLAKRKNAQIIFSTTEYHYQCTEGDNEWQPEYEGKDHKMFLKTYKD